MEKEANSDLQKELNSEEGKSTSTGDALIPNNEEEKQSSNTGSNSTYTSTTKTVGDYNFSFVTVSPK